MLPCTHRKERLRGHVCRSPCRRDVLYMGERVHFVVVVSNPGYSDPGDQAEWSKLLSHMRLHVNVETVTKASASTLLTANATASSVSSIQTQGQLRTRTDPARPDTVTPLSNPVSALHASWLRPQRHAITEQGDAVFPLSVSIASLDCTATQCKIVVTATSQAPPMSSLFAMVTPVIPAKSELCVDAML